MDGKKERERETYGREGTRSSPSRTLAQQRGTYNVRCDKALLRPLPPAFISIHFHSSVLPAEARRAENRGTMASRTEKES